MNRHLHPSSLLFTIAAQAKSFLLPGIVVLFLAVRGGGGGGELFFMVLFVPAVVASVMHYWNYRYRFDRDELVIREGIVFRNERHVPYARIQNVNLSQNPLHRLLGVAEVRLETAGGEKPEATMRVLSLEAVSEMRAHIFAGDRRRESPGETPAEAEPVRSLHTMGLREVLLFGLISNKGMVVVAAAMGALWQLDLEQRLEAFVSPESLERVKETIPKQTAAGTLILALLAVVAFVVLVRVLSVIWALTKFHGFRLTRTGEDLRAEYGLWPRVSKTVPRHRIQVVSTRQGLLHRWCGRVAVQVETAGSAGDEHGSSGRVWLAPLVREARLGDLLRGVLPEVDLAHADWQPLSPRTRRRLFRLTLYLAAAVAIPLVIGLGPWGLVAPAVGVALGWIASGLYVTHTAYALTSSAVFSRKGWWIRRLSVARFGKIQSLDLVESPFDRRHGMASVAVDTAGATRIGHAVDIHYLEAGTAAALADRLYEEAGRTAFRW